MEDWYGKILVLDKDTTLKYVGEGPDPAEDPHFKAWASALKSAMEEDLKDGMDKR